MLREIFQDCDKLTLYRGAADAEALGTFFAFSSYRPPQTVHSLGMPLAETPQPNQSQTALGNLP
jgi:hypothetical protein